MPRFAAPNLFFHVPEMKSEMFKIGETRDEHWICVSPPDGGKIVEMDPGGTGAQFPFNSSIEKMCECLLAYQEMVEIAITTGQRDAASRNHIPDYLIAKAAEDIQKIDAESCQSDSFWVRELLRRFSKTKD